MFKESACSRFAVLVGVVFCTMFAIVLFASLPAFAYADTESETYEVTVEGTYHQTEARSMLAMVNKFRTAKVDHNDGNTPWYKTEDGSYVDVEGLSELKWDYGLEKVAMQRAADLSYFYDHYRPDGSAPCGPVNDISYSTENIACGTDLNSAVSAFKIWREDNLPYVQQGHRRAMLNSCETWSSIAIACFEANGAYYWAMVFGASCASVETEPLDKPTTASIPVCDKFLYGL